MSNVRRVVKAEDNINLLKRRCLSFIPFLFAISAFCCSYTSNFHNCSFISFIPQYSKTTTTIENNSNDFFRPRSLSYGLWMYQQQRITTIQNNELMYDEYCTGYDPHSINIFYYYGNLRHHFYYLIQIIGVLP
jgi:hypothetical protein